MLRLNLSDHKLRTFLTITSILVSSAVCVAGQRGASISRAVGASSSAGAFVSYGWGGYGGFAPFSGGYYAPPAGSYLPAGWWTGYNGNTDPRGPTYNPNAGYAWESATTVLLETLPTKARVVLDGIFIGLADSLGPMQLPSGQHTLRVEAAGYESSDTVLKVGEPTLQQLTVKLTEVRHGSKPAPHP